MNSKETPMTRNEALEIAKANHIAHCKADIEAMFRGKDLPKGSDYGHSNGWYTVGEYSFSVDEITGIRRDRVQEAFANL